MSLVPYKRNIAEEKKILEELLKESPAGGDDDFKGTGLMTKLANGNYAFTSIQYQGRVIPVVELSPEYLEKGANKTQEDWAKFSKKEDWCVTDTEILYQCLSRAYAMRTDPKHQKTVQEFREAFHKIFIPGKYICTLTKASYGNKLDAVISSVGPFPKTEQVTVPEFTRQNNDWCYLVLAPEQPENQPGKTSPLQPNALPIMKALLGKDYKQAGPVFQYFSTLKNKNLREARLWTPTSTNRNKTWVVALGVLIDGFSIYASVIIYGNGPALGVRGAKKSP
jgi:hypothetical protein